MIKINEATSPPINRMIIKSTANKISYSDIDKSAGWKNAIIPSAPQL